MNLYRVRTVKAPKFLCFWRGGRNCFLERAPLQLLLVDGSITASNVWPPRLHLLCRPWRPIMSSPEKLSSLDKCSPQWHKLPRRSQGHIRSTADTDELRGKSSVAHLSPKSDICRWRVQMDLGGKRVALVSSSWCVCLERSQENYINKCLVGHSISFTWFNRHLLHIY